MSMTANMDSNNIAWYFGGREENSDGSMTYVRIWIYSTVLNEILTLYCRSAIQFNDVYIYDANHSYWGSVFDSAQLNVRPSYSAGHTANLV
jgi:hypothetical protein